MSGSRKNKVFLSIEECPVEYTGTLPNRFINIKNHKYNYLEVLYLVGFKNGRSEWLCKCLKCGRYTIINSHNLRSGHTKTCGCAISESLREDITGKTFNMLKVISYDKSINENPYWLVECLNCGKIYSVNGDALRGGKQYSCGCMNISMRANIIKDKLKQWAKANNREFTTEKMFEDCTFRTKLRFDFYIGKYDGESKDITFGSSPVLIEYDGEQHYHPVKFNNISDTQAYKQFITTQITDWCKDLYCINNNINLIRIKYSNSRHPNFEQIYDNSYIVGKAQSSDKIIEVFDVNDTDFVNYKTSTFNIASGISCTFKCGHNLCQNCELTQRKTIKCNIDNLIKRYMSQNISSSITFQGLEPLDNMKQLLWFIYYLRKVCDDPVIIWTGYTKDECEDLIYLIEEKMEWNNIIIKFGRYIPYEVPHYDPILGVKLASDNQFAERIS